MGEGKKGDYLPVIPDIFYRESRALTFVGHKNVNWLRRLHDGAFPREHREMHWLLGQCEPSSIHLAFGVHALDPR